MRNFTVATAGAVGLLQLAARTSAGRMRKVFMRVVVGAMEIGPRVGGMLTQREGIFALKTPIALAYETRYVSLPVPKVNGFVFGDGKCPPGREARFVSPGKNSRKCCESHLTRSRHGKYVGRLPLKAVS